MNTNTDCVAGGARRRRYLLAARLFGGLFCVLFVNSIGHGQDLLFSSSPIDDAIEPIAFYDNFLAGGDDEADEEPTIEERLAKLEEKYDEQGEDYEKLENDYKSLKKSMKTLAASGHSDATMKVNGRIHADMWTFPNSDAGVNVFETGNPLLSPQDQLGFRRMRFGVKGKLWKTMEYKIEMEFAGGNDSEFRDVYLGWNELPVLQTVLLGNQKRPYGLDHLNSSRYNVFLERPFVIESFNQDARRLGLQSYGVSQDENWNWRYGVFNQRLIQDEGNYRSDHWQMEFAGRLANTFWYDEASDGRGYGHWAVSSTFADPDGTAGGNRASNEARFRQRPEARSVNRWLNTGRIAGADNYQLLGLENVWNFGALQLVGETQNLWLQRDAGFGPDIHLNGAYVYAAYFLTGEHMPWSRKSGTLGRIKPIENFFLVDTCHDGVRGGWGAWQIAYRWSYADFNDDNIFGGQATSHTFGLNWYWNPYARMQFNAIYGETENATIVNGTNTGNIADLNSGNYSILGARFMVDF